MADEEHVALLKQGVDAWNAWRHENYNAPPNLRRADLSEANLSEANLSGASPDGILTMLRGLEAGARTLLMVGHNPGFEDLAKLLAGSGNGDSQARLMQGYPPAGLAVIDFSVEDWPEAAPAFRADRPIYYRVLAEALQWD